MWLNWKTYLPQSFLFTEPSQAVEIHSQVIWISTLHIIWWWPGDARSQGISIHDIDLICHQICQSQHQKVEPSVAVGYHIASYIIGSDNGLLPNRHQAITWTIADFQLWDPGTFQWVYRNKKSCNTIENFVSEYYFVLASVSELISIALLRALWSPQNVSGKILDWELLSNADGMLMSGIQEPNRTSHSNTNVRNPRTKHGMKIILLSGIQERNMTSHMEIHLKNNLVLLSTKISLCFFSVESCLIIKNSFSRDQ